LSPGDVRRIALRTDDDEIVVINVKVVAVGPARRSTSGDGRCGRGLRSRPASEDKFMAEGQGVNATT